MSLKIAIYTAVFGGKDVVQEPVKYIKNENIDYFLISDNQEIKSKCYKVIYKKPIYDDITKNARFYKIIGLDLFNEYDYVIWHDANIQIVHNEILKVLRFVENKGIAFFKHPDRNCIYDEAIKCIQLEKDYPFKILKQILGYYIRGIKNEVGLYETGFFVRNNKFRNKDFTNLWWNEIKNKSRRDQLSLPYSLNKTNIFPNIIEGTVRDNLYSIFHKHSYEQYLFLSLKVKKYNTIKKRIVIKLIKLIKRINKVSTNE